MNHINRRVSLWQLTIIKTTAATVTTITTCTTCGAMQVVAHGNATLAKWLSILSLIVAAVALAVSVAAMDRAGDAQGSASRALDSVRAQ